MYIMISRENITKHKIILNKSRIQTRLLIIQTNAYLTGTSHLGSRCSSRNIYLLLVADQQSQSSETMFHVIIYDS